MSPVDGSPVVGPPMLDAATARATMEATVAEHTDWASVSLNERKARVREAIARLDANRDLLALLLAWEIGKPWRSPAPTSTVASHGVRWYLEEIDEMLVTDVDGGGDEREPLSGPVSNIASWNYPVSVLVHSELVQLLAGNAVIAKTPTAGGGSR